MNFAQPIWLIAGLAIIVVVVWLYRLLDLRQRVALAEFASSHLLAKLTASFSPGRRRVKRFFFLLSIALTCVALARPQWGYHWEEEKQRGIDLLFAIDTSKSMLTQDVTPNRLTRAKMATTDFVRKLDGDRVGLIAFAGDAFLQAPLTLDYDAFNESLDAIDTNTIPRGGTDVASAIQEAAAAFGKSPQNKKILVLITDGEDLESKGIDAAKSAAKNGMTIFTVGVGSSAGGLIPVPVDGGGTDFLKDSSGQFVKSHLDESTLTQIAEASGGIYQPLGQQGEGLQAIYNKVVASVPKHDLASKREKIYEERFQWPLAAAILALFASVMIGTRRREVKVSAPAKRRTPVAASAALILLSAATVAQASPQSAERAYKKGDYGLAETQYKQAVDEQPQAAPLQYNLGASAYKTGAFDEALPAFQKALGTDDVGVQQQAYYNMGNTEYRVGQKTEKDKPDETIKTWQTAIQAYDAALKLKGDDADAKYNRDFVQKKLDELQKKNPPKQDQKKDDQKKDDQKKDQQKQDQQNQQDQQKQDQQKQQNQSGSGQNPQDKQNGQQDKDSKDGQNDQKQNSQQQAQNGQPDQKKDGQGQPKDQQSGQQQTADQQGQKPQDGNKDQQKSGGDQVAQNGQGGQASPDKNQGPDKNVGDEAEQAQPGEMSRQEAKDLLNSLKNDEHALPVTADVRNAAGHPQAQPTLKDW